MAGPRRQRPRRRAFLFTTRHVVLPPVPPSPGPGSHIIPHASFSPQRESRALIEDQNGCDDADAPEAGPPRLCRAGSPMPQPVPMTTPSPQSRRNENGNLRQSPNSPSPSPHLQDQEATKSPTCHSRRSGNPEPLSRTKTAVMTETGQGAVPGPKCPDQTHRRQQLLTPSPREWQI